MLWVISLALFYALMLSRASSGATVGVLRVAFRRTMLTAGRSALDEASFALRHPLDGQAPALRAMQSGGRTGTAFEPRLTRDAYRPLIDGGRLDIGAVTYQVVSRPSSDEATGPWQIDLSVGLGASVGPAGGLRVTRTLTRRMHARLFRLVQRSGPAHRIGRLVHSELQMEPDVIYEVSAP